MEISRPGGMIKYPLLEERDGHLWVNEGLVFATKMLITGSVAALILLIVYLANALALWSLAAYLIIITFAWGAAAIVLIQAERERRHQGSYEAVSGWLEHLFSPFLRR